MSRVDPASPEEPGVLSVGFRRMGVGGVQHAVVAGGSRLLAFAGVSVLLRHLRPEEFGAYSLALLNEQVAFILVGLALANAMGAFYSEAARGLREENVVVGTAVIGMTVLALAGGVLWQLLAVPVARLTLSSVPDAVAITRLVGVSLVGGLLLNVVSTIWLLGVRMRPFAVATLAQYGLASLLSGVLVASFDAGPVGAMAGWAAGTVAAGLGAMAWVLRHYRLAFDPRVLRQMLAYGFPLVPGALVMLVLQVNDRYLLKAFGGLADVGRYAAPFAVATGLYSVVVAAFKRIWTALMWQTRDQPHEQEFHRRALVYYIAGQAWVLVVVTTFGDIALRILAGGGTEYAGASGVIAIVYGGFVIFGMWDVLSAGYFFAGRTVYYTVSVVIATVAAVAFNLALIPVWGLWAAALSNPLAFAVMTAVSRHFARRYFPVHHDWRRIAAVVVAAVVAGSAAMAIRAWDNPVAVPLALLPIAALPVAIYRSLDERERNVLRMWKDGLLGRRLEAP
ncbi:MAG: polysaccharide biosynthesis C-terminal domain-containing protein [Acidimicrobiia bacterium]